MVISIGTYINIFSSTNMSVKILFFIFILELVGAFTIYLPIIHKYILDSQIMFSHIQV